MSQIGSIQDFTTESDSYLSESSGSENFSDIWSDDDEGKEQEVNENFVVLFAFEPKALMSSAGCSVQPDDVGLEEEVLVKDNTNRTSNLGW